MSDAIAVFWGCATLWYFRKTYRLERQLRAERELRIKFEHLAETYAADADVLRRVIRERERPI